MIYFYIALGICGGLALFAVFFYLSNNLLKTTRYTFDCNVERGVKIVQLSDLHGKEFGKNNRKLIEKVLAEKPDFVVITGDIIHKYTEKNKRNALRLVSSLSAAVPVLFSAGNHEMRNKGYRFFRRDLMEAGAQVLDNCSHDICGLTVVGLNCASQKNKTIEKITPQNDKIKILLAHLPHTFCRYENLGYTLVLSGHAHGGQWRIPFTRIGIYAPGQGMFPKYTSGVHGEGETKLVISRGLGNSEFPLRLFNRPEIVVIELNKKG